MRPEQSNSSSGVYHMSVPGNSRIPGDNVFISKDPLLSSPLIIEIMKAFPPADPNPPFH